MSFEIEYSLSSIPDFDWLIDKIEKPRELLQEIADYRRQRFQATAARGIDPYDRPYASLSRMYALQKAARYGSRPILTATGGTIGSYKVDASDRQIKETVDGGTAGYHQFGTSKMPRRQLLPGEGLPPKDTQKLIEITMIYLEEQFSRMPKK